MTDAAGNSDTVACQVTIQDTAPPALDCAADVTVAALADRCVGLAGTPQATASDLCEGDLPATAQPAQGEWALGTTEVLHTATDGSGNTNTCVSTVTALDQTAPAAECTDLTLECTGALTAAPTTCDASDACDAELALQSTAAASYALGGHTYDCSATDDSGNTGSATCAVVIEDTTAPSVTCEAAVQFSADAACGSDEVVAGASQDICEGALAVASDAPARFALGETTVTFSAADSTGNAAQCTTAVTVVDDTAPTAAASAAPVTLEADAQCVATTQLDGSASADNCGIVRHAWSEGERALGDTARVAASVTGHGPHTLTLQVCDAAGGCDAADVQVQITRSQMACDVLTKANLKLAGGDDDSSDDDGSSDDGDATHLHLDGTFAFNDCVAVDLIAQGASVTVDGLSYAVPAGAFRAKGRSGKVEYTFKRRRGLEWKLEVDPRRQTWSFKAKRFDGEQVSAADGLDVTFTFGDQIARETVALTRRGRGGQWNFKVDRRAPTCEPARDDDSSDDDSSDDDRCSDDRSGDDASDDDLDSGRGKARRGRRGRRR